MGNNNWFRNKSWSSEIEISFYERLRRARNKFQYLRIQASYLSKIHPKIALRLIDEYFLLGDNFDQAQAHVNRAEAYLTLSNVDAAIGSYEDALERERLDPHLLTYAYLDLPLLIVKLRLSHLYSRALQILDTHLSRVMFPMDRYVANGARALILQEQGDETGAGLCAERALAAASEVQSGFRYHQDVGLVGDIDDDFGRRLQTLVASRR